MGAGGEEGTAHFVFSTWNKHQLELLHDIICGFVSLQDSGIDMLDFIYKYLAKQFFKTFFLKIESLVSNPDVIFVFADKINKVDHIPCLSFSLSICEMWGNQMLVIFWWCSSAVPQPVLTVIEQEAF